MFKDYYQILGIDGTATFDEIKAAYRSLSKKWHPDLNPNRDAAEVTRMMQDINEAYAILKDDVKRHAYDKEYQRFKQQKYQQQSTKSCRQNSNRQQWEYDYHVEDERLRDDIQKAREYAAKLVAEFLSSLKKSSKDAAKGACEGVKAPILAVLFLIVIGFLINAGVLCNQPTENSAGDYSRMVESYDQQDMAVATQNSDAEQKNPEDDSRNEGLRGYQASIVATKTSIPTFETPEGWSTYFIDNQSFCMAVPNTLELRNEGDQYTKRLQNVGWAVNLDNVVFQQRGLARSVRGTEDAHYCRVIVSHIICAPGEVYQSTETDPIVGQLKQDLLELVESQLFEDQVLLCSPSYRWINVYDETKAIEVRYRRTGNRGNTTQVTIYILSNNDEMVMMIVAYRESEAHLWAADMQNVIKTFRWKKSFPKRNSGISKQI